MNPLDLVRPDLAGFVPYASARRSGAPAPVRLDANEAPWAPCGDTLDLNRYPAPQPPALLAALAQLYGVRDDQLFVGRGSDEAIDLLVRAFCRAGIDNIVALAPGFGMYRIAARIQGAGCREVTLQGEDGFALSVARILAQVDTGTRLVFLCSPNNPTGTSYHDLVEQLLQALDGRALLVVDEAYIEFSDTASAAAMLDRYPHLVVLRTLSKAHALAGARVGSLMASPELVGLIAAIAPPYPLPAPCVEAALRVLEAQSLLVTVQRIAAIRQQRDHWQAQLARCRAVRKVWPSQGNFLLLRLVDAKAAYRSLLDAGIIVRDVSAQPGLDGCLRVTIGSPDENARVLDVLVAMAEAVPA
ncbi:histidinol-phosphate transaminase [Pseudofulvimonas gallinarii]|uniref:Histidinol-phosphate aminotransferase n=1 Tax=Pseudofulvimonas gallinarii TaxID=634155 RepID=A0A4S3KVZ9_9GAMM|nr:histidinol-phosphate transaminase [Pseudofulvimonas gallinarii]TCS97567.1 histidinol phosphate aminotransferase [Pseudofulvimonas gallinarii]THD13453.1 histidinol-phosphate transaminase [Pseudofulvimonas gallinarii]